MVSCSYTGDPNDLVINQRIAEDTNVNINWVDLGTGTERLEKLKLLLNSGDYGDGIYSMFPSPKRTSPPTPLPAY